MDVQVLERLKTKAAMRQEDNFRPLGFPIVAFKYICTRNYSALICLHCGVSDSVDLMKEQTCLPLDVQELGKSVWVGRPLPGMQCPSFFLYSSSFCPSQGIYLPFTTWQQVTKRTVEVEE